MGSVVRDLKIGGFQAWNMSFLCVEHCGGRGRWACRGWSPPEKAISGWPVGAGSCAAFRNGRMNISLFYVVFYCFLIVYISSFWSLAVSQQWKRSFLMWDPKAVKSALPPRRPTVWCFQQPNLGQAPRTSRKRCRWNHDDTMETAERGLHDWEMLLEPVRAHRDNHLNRDPARPLPPFIAQVWGDIPTVSQHLTFQHCVPLVAHELVAAMPSSCENCDDRGSLDARGALHWESSHKGLETLYRAVLLPTQILWGDWLGPRVSGGPKWHWRATGSEDYVFMGSSKSGTSSDCGGDKSDAGDSHSLNFGISSQALWNSCSPLWFKPWCRKQSPTVHGDLDFAQGLAKMTCKESVEVLTIKTRHCRVQLATCLANRSVLGPLFAHFTMFFSFEVMGRMSPYWLDV